MQLVHQLTHTTAMERNPYIANGYANRKEYLESLCEEYPRDAVMTLADILGPNEDFDGLITHLEDADLSDFE